jgi:hypothetical protein
MKYKVSIVVDETEEVLYEQQFKCLDVGQVAIWLNTHKSNAVPDVPSPAPTSVVAQITSSDEDVPF